MGLVGQISWEWFLAGAGLGAVAAGAIVWYLVCRGRRPSVPVFAPPASIATTKQRVVSRKAAPGESGPPAENPLPSEVPEAVMAQLRAGKELHELDFNAIESVALEADAKALDQVDDLLRMKIVKCVSSRRINELLTPHADALWGCVLNWDPLPTQLEKQSLEIMSWSCRNFGNFPDAVPVVAHSRHGIPLPASLSLMEGCELMFDRTPSALLGEGASSAVYRAHLEGHEDVAVKVSRLTGHSILGNMLLEYFMLRRASDIEGVIDLYGGGYYEADEASYLFIVEELTETTLGHVFERRKASGEGFTEQEVREELVKPLLQALRDIHRRGILHRDVKPRNIHYVNGRYKLGDFEIAAYAHDPSRVLISGTFAGSPAFSTAAALQGRYGPQTDINALACIAHMLLHGELPAMEEAPGTSTLVRGIGAGSALSEDQRLAQEKARAAVREWLVHRRFSVRQIRESPYSTAFDRFFVAPIMTQGLYAGAEQGEIATAEDALACLAKIELYEEARESCKQATTMLNRGEKDEARRLLEKFDAKFRGTSGGVEIGIHVMIRETLEKIEGRTTDDG